MAENVEFFPHTAARVPFIFMLYPLQHNLGGFPALNPDVSVLEALLFVGVGQQSFQWVTTSTHPFWTHTALMRATTADLVCLCNCNEKKHFIVTPFQISYISESQAAVINLEQSTLV